MQAATDERRGTFGADSNIPNDYNPELTEE
jgi:hypothetical protein